MAPLADPHSDAGPAVFGDYLESSVGDLGSLAVAVGAGFICH